ncbi:hypothetical protein GCM10009661_21900 [Catellatospora chokoriensis]|uniref:Uncharacterized protein n=1 Tax=Catellatospora chokoriensis TaxID=310353 RepID=A0A8J3JQN4_9ACTN|nr:hypothetical protein Cch02nite_27710 [Catellatospora chokoriensis]
MASAGLTRLQARGYALTTPPAIPGRSIRRLGGMGPLLVPAGHAQFSASLPRTEAVRLQTDTAPPGTLPIPMAM